MNDPKANELIQEIGTLIVNDRDYRNENWHAIALVGDFSHGQKSITGYCYFAEGKFSGKIPDQSWELTNMLQELRDTMSTSNDSDKGNHWHQCLIHITKPSMKIAIQFEYDDPDRWSPGGKSLDMSAYAKLLQPTISD